jgi:hypothetical protein
MDIQINTDKTIENSSRLQNYFATELQTALSGFRIK